jgi:hypothetical protein
MKRLLNREDNSHEHSATRIGFYQLFLQTLKQVCSQDAKSIDEISEYMQLHKLQVRKWLEQARDEGAVMELKKPARYQWNGSSVVSRQNSLF